MTEVMERDPAMMPTIVRRVSPEGSIETLERVIDLPHGQEKALCVFWSIEHARRDMYAKGCHPEDGWRPIERDDQELELVFEMLAEFGGATLAYVEPAPGAPELCALLRPEELIALLRECAFD